jgi:neutral ceramidase
MALRAGVARVLITPPIGIEMTGFAGRGPADGIHDDLTATALVLEGPDALSKNHAADPPLVRLAIVCCDLLYLPSQHVREVRAAVGRLAGLPLDYVIISCSHTHYGPQTDIESGEPQPQVQAYLANLTHTLAGVIALASAHLTPCLLGTGTGEIHIGVNRRERLPDGQIILGQNPDGPCDSRLTVIRVDTIEGKPLAAVINCACHGVSLGGTCTHITADFPGVARRLLEQQTGATSLFLQGAAGNINPLLMGWDWTHIARLGLPLGAEAVRVYWNTAPSAAESEGGIGVASLEVDLPSLLPASVTAGHKTISALETERADVSTAADQGRLWWIEQRLERARRGLEALQGAPLSPISAELSALRLGSTTALVTAPGEVFTEIGQSIVARSPFTHTLYAGYTNGSIWYVPTRAAYTQGGYEIEFACKVAPEAGEILEESSVALLERVVGVR